MCIIFLQLIQRERDLVNGESKPHSGGVGEPKGACTIDEIHGKHTFTRMVGVKTTTNPATRRVWGLRFGEREITLSPKRLIIGNFIFQYVFGLYNENFYKTLGIDESFIGTTGYDVYPEEIAEHIVQHDKEVIRSGVASTQEEPTKDIRTGTTRYFNAFKAPVRDEHGNVIGLVGTLIEITAQKYAEQLKLENEKHKAENEKHAIQAQEHEKFKKIADQVVHDIRSPLAALDMFTTVCDSLPEEERIALREISTTITDIANNLLNQYNKAEEASELIEWEEPKPVLVSAILLQLLTDKRYQYRNLLIKFESKFDSDSYFAFIKVQVTCFKRLLSNLINNAVDAFDKKEGKVILRLKCTEDAVKISVIDNGKGMPQEVVEKILNNITVTQDKQGGHGIGLTQVREALQRNQGALDIASQVGEGTTIDIIFPREDAPDWIAEELNLNTNDIIVIVDDDPSIHKAWDARLKVIQEENPGITIEHFNQGRDAIKYISMIDFKDEDRVFLLNDYELLKQDINGLDIIQKTRIRRSILVTSHYANHGIRAQAKKIGTTILPKQLASIVPIKISGKEINSILPLQTNIVEENNSNMACSYNATVVLVDDNKVFLNNLASFAFKGKIVDKFYSPEDFLLALPNYSKDTTFCLDNNFSNSNLTGLDLINKLYSNGYTNLYLLSGEEFINKPLLPDIPIILKNDLNGIKKYFVNNKEE